MQACSKLFHATLQDMRDKIEPVLTSNLYQSPDIPDTKVQNSIKQEHVKKEIHHESRWESTHGDTNSTAVTSSKHEAMDVNDMI